MVGYRNRNSRGHIISIEDPIEFIHEHAGCIVTQREVGMDTESFDVAPATLDRFRTTVNVWGDSVGAGVVETLELRGSEAE